MASLTLRQIKGAALTHTELDNNFTNLNTELGTKVVSVNGETGAVILDTDDISEGATKKYFSQSLARGSVSAGTGISYSSSTGVIAVDTATIATRSYTDTAIANLVDSAPATLDTLNELAAALGDDPNFATTISNSLANKLNTSAFNSTADTWLGTKSTTNLAEGTNQYFTQARARTSISAGTGISYNNSTGVITSSITQYTDALARASLSGSGGVTYNSSTGAISLTTGVVAAGTYAGRVTVDTTGRVTAANNDITGRIEPIFDLGTTGGTIAPNAANGAVQKITLNSALTINGFTSPVAGQSITLFIYGGTAYTSITSSMKFLGGTKALTGTTGCIDVLTIYYDGTTYFASIGKGFA